MTEDKGKDGDAERTRRADALIARMKAARGYIYYVSLTGITGAESRTMASARS